VEGPSTETKWAEYRQARRKQELGPNNGEDAGAYIPDPDELQQRLEDLAWLKHHNFSDELQDSIMIQDCPVMETVRRLADIHGIPETKRRLRKFLKG